MFYKINTYIFILLLISFKLFANSHKPNIILINADDLGYGDLSCYGATKVQTPNIDKLAKEGRRYTDAHSSSAVCSPSRYGLLTGKYPIRKNFWGPTPNTQSLTIERDQENIASLMRQWYVLNEI